MTSTGSASMSLFSFSVGVDLQMDRIFATPSVILRSARSVGMALAGMWSIGAIVAAAGSAVYLQSHGAGSVMNSGSVGMYRSGVADSTPEQRREELFRRCLQTSQVYGNLCLCHVSAVYCEPSSAPSPHLSHRSLETGIC